jgi:hypothetical protein
MDESRYYSTWGPQDGVIRHAEAGGITLGVVSEAGVTWRISEDLPRRTGVQGR